MNLLDKDLCEKVRLGDTKAFNVLFKAYYASLCTYAYDLIKNQDAAEEIVHKLFITFWKDREEFSITTNLRGYLFRSVHNRCLNYIRDTKNNNSKQLSIDDSQNTTLLIALETPPEIIEKLFAEQLEKLLSNALHSLPVQCRTIFCLARFENLTYPEIANKLNLALSTVKTQMIRAMSKLKKEIEKQL